MKEYYELLKKIELRPAMWTGEHSLKSIWIFLGGYSLALHDFHLIDLQEEYQPDFNDWVAKKLGFTESTAGWHNMILAYTLGLPPRISWKNIDAQAFKEQHSKSIKLFYLLLDEFVK